MCSLVQCISTSGATPGESVVSEVLLDTVKIKDKTQHRIKMSKIEMDDKSKQLYTIKSFDELRRNTGLSTKYKLELTIRLSLAILQLWETPWVSESWTWNDMYVTMTEVSIPNESLNNRDNIERAESSLVFIFHRRIFSITYDSGALSASRPYWRPLER